MASYETVILEKLEDEHIAKLTLNRPDRLNAINPQMQDELAQAIEEVDADDNMRVMILTGAGRGFCAGADTTGMGQQSQEGAEASRHAGSDAEQLRRNFKYVQRFILGLQRMEKPVIAMVNGAAVGAGFDLACACDIRIGSSSARFMVAYIRVGLFPGYGGTWLYQRVLGNLGKTAELLFTGEFLEAEDASKYGVLNHLVPAEELEGFTMEMARKIAAGPPIAMRLAKLMLYKGLEMDLETAMQMAAAAETITLTSQDHQEGLAAFRERRTANFEGR